jgi:hypothetical protein
MAAPYIHHHIHCNPLWLPPFLPSLRLNAWRCCICRPWGSGVRQILEGPRARCCAVFAIYVFFPIVRMMGTKWNGEVKIHIPVSRTTMDSEMDFTNDFTWK